MTTQESNLEILKVDYSKLKEKYALPNFDNLNRDFSIEKIADIETNFLIREVRKFMTDKFSNYLRFIEILLHPVNTPIFIFSIVKAINTEDKKELTEIYKKLAKIEVKLIELDLEFVEEKEITFVKETYQMWQEMKRDLLRIVDTIKKNWDNKVDVNGRRYFG